MQTAGIILKWFRDEFCRDLILQNDNAFAAMSGLAEGAPPLSRGLICFPHFAGMAAEPEARGVFFGANLETGRDCFIRSIMEAVGYMLKDSLDLLDTRNDVIHSMGGGAKSEIWNQIKADICNKPVYLMEEEETASLGAAVLGMLAVGQLADIQETSALIKTKRVYTPDDNAVELYREGYARYTRLCQSMSGMFK
jgi:xylulokinase